jgi:hypothetical protein
MYGAQALLAKHACYMSEENEATIDGLRYNMEFDKHGAPVADTADLALRTCLCGALLDGFDEYHAHLVDVFEKAGYER